MTSVKTLIAACTIAAFVSPLAATALELNAPGSRPIVVAQADAVAAAEAAVEAARAAYREALVTERGKQINPALRAVNEAIAALNDARTAAGLPPVDLSRELGEDRIAAAMQVVEEARARVADTIANGGNETRARRRLDEALASLDGVLAAEGVPPAERQAALEEPPAGVQPQLVPPPPQPPQPGQLAQPPITPLPPVVTAPGLLPRGGPAPRFGEAQQGQAPVQLPKSETAVQEGQAIQAGEGRVIERRGGQITITHDDTDRFRQQGERVQVARSQNGFSTTTINRPNGVEVVTVRDRDGNIVQRYRKNTDGSIEILIGAAPGGGGRALAPPPPPLQLVRPPVVSLPPLRLQIPRQDYIVESSRATDRQIQQALIAPPVERVERAYSLEEIRRSARLRDKVRRIDFDTVTFEFGSAVVPPDQIPKMQRLGDAIRAIIQADSGQVLLVEGHTDAVGSDLANLALSDRRAETVAEILTYYFGIPPENLVTQGYGEQFLKVPTLAAERENRRVVFRNITYLMRASG